MQKLERTGPPVNERRLEAAIRVVIGYGRVIRKTSKTPRRKGVQVRTVCQRISGFRQIASQRQERLQPHLPSGRVKPHSPHKRVPVAEDRFWITDCISRVAVLYSLILDVACGVKNLALGRGSESMRCVVEIGMAGDVRGTDEGDTLIARGVGRVMLVDFEDRGLV